MAKAQKMNYYDSLFVIPKNLKEAKKLGGYWDSPTARREIRMAEKLRKFYGKR